MAEHQGKRVVDQQLADVAAVERDIEAALDRQTDPLQAYPEAASVLTSLHSKVVAQCRSVEEHLNARHNEGAPVNSPLAALFEASFADAASHSGRVSGILRADYTAFSYAAMSHAILYEMTLRLYDAPLRALAPSHMQTYASAAQKINETIAGVMARELQQEGLECMCICPMCSMGACGCVAVGTESLHMAWRETVPEVEAAPGFYLPPPRSDSQLGLADIRGGDRLLDVDGQPVHSFRDIQAAIRKHKIGDGMRLRIATGTEAPREVSVKHVSDYPSS
jgi:hypothetical protein